MIPNRTISVQRPQGSFEELGMLAREQAAVIRALVDEIRRRAAPEEVSALEEQLSEELVRYERLMVVW